MAWIEKWRPETEQHSVDRRQIGCTSPRPVNDNDKELLFHKQAVGDDSPGSARSKEFGECGQKMGE